MATLGDLSAAPGISRSCLPSLGGELILVERGVVIPWTGMAVLQVPTSHLLPCRCPPTSGQIPTQSRQQWPSLRRPRREELVRAVSHLLSTVPTQGLTATLLHGLGGALGRRAG